MATTGGRARGGGAGTTELDTHANMVVIGVQGTIVHKTGRYADVNAFSSDVGILSQVSGKGHENTGNTKD